MKRITMLLVVLVAIFSAQFSHAVCWTGDFTWVSQAGVGFTASNGAITNRTFLLPSNTTAKNQFMALALTAISSGKSAYFCTAAATAKSVVTAIQVRQ